LYDQLCKLPTAKIFLALQSLIEYLTSIHPLSAAAIEAVENICVEVGFKKNELVQPIGHTCKTIYYVKRGALRIFYYKDGIDITESFEFEHAVVARAESLFSGRPSQKGIQALEDTQLIAINSNALFKLYDTHHDLERLFRRLFERAYVKTINRLESLQFYTAEDRYANLLKEQPDVLLRVPLKYIASFLGITQVSLSRIRAKK
jgi:CRP-like cAMP-binding protein